MNLFREFQDFRRILCLCPCCGEIVRVSDLKLRVKAPAVRTWLDDHEKNCLAMNKKEEKFEEIKDKLREEAVKKGRKEAQKVFNNALHPAFRALKLDPFDIKPILNPIDFIVFKDMTQKEKVNDIIFLSRICGNPILNKVRQQVDDVIKKRQYDWEVARINEQGKIEIE